MAGIPSGWFIGNDRKNFLKKDKLALLSQVEGNGTINYAIRLDTQAKVRVSQKVVEQWVASRPFISVYNDDDFVPSRASTSKKTKKTGTRVKFATHHLPSPVKKYSPHKKSPVTTKAIIRRRS